MKCCVENCASVYKGKGDKCSFFRFPKDAATRIKWIVFSGRKEECLTKYSIFCMHHFKREDFSNNIQYDLGFVLRRQLKEGAVPSIHPAPLEKSILCMERSARVEKRQNKKMVASILKEHTPVKQNTQEFEFVELEMSSKGADVDNITDNVEASDELEMCSKAADVDHIPANVEASDELEMSSKAADVDHIPANVEASDELSTLRMEIRHLIKENLTHTSTIRSLEEQLHREKKDHVNYVDKKEKELAKALLKIKKLEEKLEMKKFKVPVKRATYSQEDIGRSIKFYSTSPKLYNVLVRKEFPVPSVRTLQRWAKKVGVSRGFLIPPFKILEDSTQSTDEG